MLRRFQQHDVRFVADLSGIWDFTFLGEVDPDSVELATLEFTDRMAVPGCFDAMPAWPGKRGLVAYRIRVRLHDDQPHRLIFDGVQYWCRVFADGKKLCDHAGGFTQFAADIAGHQAGDIDIVVLVDNRIDYQRCPLHLDYFDWYHFGGIARSVELHRLGKLWIDALQVVTEDVATRTVTVTIDYNAAESPGQTKLVVSCDDHVMLEEIVELVASSGRIQRTLELPNAKLWSPDEPNSICCTYAWAKTTCVSGSASAKCE